MKEAVSIGMIGDYDPERPAHQAVIAALGHAADQAGVPGPDGCGATGRRVTNSARKHARHRCI